MQISDTVSVIRFKASLEKELSEVLENCPPDNYFSICSQANRQLINNHIIASKWPSNNRVAGSVPRMNSHPEGGLTNVPTTPHCDYHGFIPSSPHFHLEHDLKLKIKTAEGKAFTINELALKRMAWKGIQQGKSTMSRSG